MLDLSKDGFLKTDEVKQRANSIFTTSAAPTVQFGGAGVTYVTANFHALVR